jgi:hypothetical protein
MKILKGTQHQDQAGMKIFTSTQYQDLADKNFWKKYSMSGCGLYENL